MSLAGHPAIPVRVTVARGESCDCCGRTTDAVGRRSRWVQLGAGQTREVYCPPCHDAEADRAKDPDR